MTTWNANHPDGSTASRPSLLESCWQMRGPSGIVFECGVYRGDDGLELRVCSNSETVNSAPLESLEEGRARAARLKGMVCEKGGFEELAN